MLKFVCAVLPLVARVAVAAPATLSPRCDDPKAHPTPFTGPLSLIPTAGLPFNTPPIELEPIHLDPFDIEASLPHISPSLLDKPSPAPVDVESPVPSSFPTSPLGSNPKLVELNATTKIDDGRSSRKGFSDYTKKKNVVYFTDWSIYGAGYRPQDLPADDISHLLYAFAGIAADGSVIPFDPWADEQKLLGKRESQGDNVHGAVEQVFLLKQKHRHMKTLLSIGGWTSSQEGKFGPAIASAESRRRFAITAVKMLADWGFDGIDIDYEYPTTHQEAQNYVYLLREVREALDEYAYRNDQDYHYLLTVATGAGPDHYNLLDLKAMDEYLDTWHLMAYDYAGSWDNVAGQQSNVYPDYENPESTKFNTDQAVDDYIASGINPHKIVLGLPLYGRSFANTDGLGRPYSGIGAGSIEQGVWLYRDLPRPGATVHVNTDTLSAYSYDPSARELVTYDNVDTARLKAEYLLDRGLGGAVFWEASGDRTGEESLIRTMAQEMGYLENSSNMLDYPYSRYANIQNAFW
ncbi:glycoside hydrolase family 18 protein [Trichoderma barbatum]